MTEDRSLFGCDLQGDDVTAGGEKVLQARVAGCHQAPQVYITPYNIVDHGPNELFIYGGGYGDNPDASGSFVSCRRRPGCRPTSSR